MSTSRRAKVQVRVRKSEREGDVLEPTVRVGTGKGRSEGVGGDGLSRAGPARSRARAGPSLRAAAPCKLPAAPAEGVFAYSASASAAAHTPSLHTQIRGPHAADVEATSQERVRARANSARQRLLVSAQARLGRGAGNSTHTATSACTTWCRLASPLLDSESAGWGGETNEGWGDERGVGRRGRGGQGDEIGRAWVQGAGVGERGTSRQCNRKRDGELRNNLRARLPSLHRRRRIGSTRRQLAPTWSCGAADAAHAGCARMAPPHGTSHDARESVARAASRDHFRPRLVHSCEHRTCGSVCGTRGDVHEVTATRDGKSEEEGGQEGGQEGEEMGMEGEGENQGEGDGDGDRCVDGGEQTAEEE
ncbi:hypothetical protein C8F04DRAFT_1240163 [Mycena alexandri]|uniref:Uncharacterized protein n=1 Tax=Mycena alexandri TaxID=1745969 RepID=A0AAD6S8Z4_9AGAR|nr:hypothetical protein C8F04DRAFT_1240163 [Mycena alexandri]